ncbi:tetraacyldisaccharide 4'-kinase [Muriicola soli]|uniref:Tetraacyldisaccharide 4'-kinase n=1 Tax=Muriicola soli TaxID=2507538 RepID=A0A411E714_9FLAO|nr:tetraacyldisaccharide 4'-kinase [Muriicola soli]QBA63496.1 tetraacyldisaccharide 4'-kinase [Muriicola soli]
MQLLRKIAFPFSLLYAIVVYLRNLCYDTGLFNSKTFDTPTVCIGNLSTGGSGKTPMIEWVLKHLNQNKSIAVLSRGYKRQSQGFLFVNPDMSPEAAGDEPLQIATKFPNTVVAVDPNRQSGIKILEEQVIPDLILLDDAYQHRKVKATFYVLLTAYSQLYTRDWYLPTGNLRDHKNQAKRANVIIVTKCPAQLSEEEQNEVIRSLAPQPEQQVLFCTLAYKEKVIGVNETLSLESLKTREVILVTAIANPEPLLQYLRSKGIRYDHRKFPDHHYFTEKEKSEFNKAPVILTTEKDFTRMGGKVDNAYYLGVEHRFLNDGKEKFIGQLNSL